jgi:hypothetical protein
MGVFFIYVVFCIVHNQFSLAAANLRWAPFWALFIYVVLYLVHGGVMYLCCVPYSRPSDRKQRPPGGRYLSDWGAEEETLTRLKRKKNSASFDPSEVFLLCTPV